MRTENKFRRNSLSLLLHSAIFQEILEEMIDISVKSITDDTGCGRTTVKSRCLQLWSSVFLVFSV